MEEKLGLTVSKNATPDLTSRFEMPREAEESQKTGGDAPMVELARIAIVALAAALIWLRVWESFADIRLIGIVGLALGG